MSTYTIAQIVALTGIKSHTLRKWETRYSFLEPERTDTNIRYYSDKQLKKLINIGVLTRNGYRISKIDKMTESEIHEAISSKLIDSAVQDEISALVISMLNLDEVGFDQILKSQILKKGLLSTTSELLYPFLNHVGVLWGMDRVMPAQEHFISNLIKKKMFSAIDLLPYPKQDAPSIMMFLTENEYHEIGLLLAYYIAREMGWKVYYLGQNVPTDNIKQVITATNPDIMLTMFVTPSAKNILEKTEEILHESKIPLYVSGSALNMEFLKEHKKGIHLSNPDEFIDILKKRS